MKKLRPASLWLVLALLTPSAVALQALAEAPSAEPIYISQNLPPLQGPGYPGNTYPSYGTGNYPYNAQPYTPTTTPAYTSQPPLQGYVATAPAGTTVAAAVTTPISSEFARVGDRLTATLSSAVAAGSNVILPAGSQVEGQVVMVKAAGRSGRNGELEVRFTTGVLPNGQRIPLSARIQTEDGTGIIKGGTTVGRMGKAAVNTGVGAGLGAALGTAMGPLSGGGVGRGAIYGTVLGAGMGALGSAWQKGKPAVIESGRSLNVVLDQPLTMSPMAPSAPAYGQDQPYPSYYPNGGGQQQPYNVYGNSQ